MRPSERSLPEFYFIFSFPSRSGLVINIHFDLSRIPETWKFPVLNPVDDWNNWNPERFETGRSSRRRLEPSVAVERLERFERLERSRSNYCLLPQAWCLFITNTSTDTALILSPSSFILPQLPPVRRCGRVSIGERPTVHLPGLLVRQPNLV